MKRVIVALDGTDLSAAILPDARRMAGSDGQLILIHDASIALSRLYVTLNEEREAIEASQNYLRGIAETLRADGAMVETETAVMGDPARAIDEAARIYRADMIAVATHGRGGFGRLVRGSVAWRALAHSTVPVLVRHVIEREFVFTPAQPLERRVLVPLDGSLFAETALPLAQQLACDWRAEIRLTYVVPALDTRAFVRAPGLYDDTEPDRRKAEAYLDKIASGLTGDVHTHVLVGSAVDDVVAASHAWAISDVVMASHGRTGLSRVILGSVTDALIHRLDLPIIVIPALAAQTSGQPITREAAVETGIAKTSTTRREEPVGETR